MTYKEWKVKFLRKLLLGKWLKNLVSYHLIGYNFHHKETINYHASRLITKWNTVLLVRSSFVFLTQKALGRRNKRGIQREDRQGRICGWLGFSCKRDHSLQYAAQCWNRSLWFTNGDWTIRSAWPLCGWEQLSACLSLPYEVSVFVTDGW